MTEEVVGGILNNKWPCCHRATQWHDIRQYTEGDVREVQCKKDGRKWRVTFTVTRPFKNVAPFLKLNWEEVGGRSS